MLDSLNLLTSLSLVVLLDLCCANANQTHNDAAAKSCNYALNAIMQNLYDQVQKHIVSTLFTNIIYYRMGRVQLAVA